MSTGYDSYALHLHAGKRSCRTEARPQSSLKDRWYVRSPSVVWTHACGFALWRTSWPRPIRGPACCTHWAIRTGRCCVRVTPPAQSAVGGAWAFPPLPEPAPSHQGQSIHGKGVPRGSQGKGEQCNLYNPAKICLPPSSTQAQSGAVVMAFERAPPGRGASIPHHTWSCSKDP